MVMDSKPPSPQSVGREFVRQYYTLLNQAPLHLHRFYSANSSFVHGGLDAINEGRDGGGKVSTDPVHGQHEIHQRIMQLNFRDCKAKIRQVDAHASLGSGVVVQVSGELSNQGQPMRRFMQTFVLAPQGSKKYYVHNDIFRYQDEVFSEADGGTSACVTSGTRGQDVIDERGNLLESPSPNEMVQNEKNAAGVSPPCDSPMIPVEGHGLNSINNNKEDGAKGGHGQQPGMGRDGIMTVSINPSANVGGAEGDVVTPNLHPTKHKGNESAGPAYLNGGSNHGPGMQLTSPPISPQQHPSQATVSTPVAAGLSPAGVSQSRGSTVLGAHTTPPGAAHGYVAGAGPPPGHPVPGQVARSPQSKNETNASDATAASPLSSDGKGDGSPSGPVKKSNASVNSTEEHGDDKTTTSSASTTSSTTGSTAEASQSTPSIPTYASLAARISAKQGPGLQVQPGGLPPAGFNKSSSGNPATFGASGGSGQGQAPSGMPAGAGSAPRNSQSGDMSKEGTPISTTGGSGQGKGERGGFNNRPGGRGASGRPSMGGSGSGGRDRFNSTNRDDAQSDTQERRRNNTTAMYPDSQQLFVGNLPHNCTESDLESLFSQFGKVAEIRINSKGVAQSKIMPSGQRVPNFGFVVFETDAAVQECLKHTPVHLPDGHRLNVETKKNNKQMRTEGSVDGGSGNNYGGRSSGGGQSSGGGNQSFSGSSGGQGGSKGGRGGQGSGGGNVTGSGTEPTGGMGSSGNRGSQESLPRDGGGGGRGSWGRGSRGASRGGRDGGRGGGSGGQTSGGMYSGGGGRGSGGSQVGQAASSQGGTTGGRVASAAYAGPGGGNSRRS